MSKISIKNQEERDGVMMWVSDLYKDVYGMRPRGYNFSEWSNQELADFVNDLSDEQEREVAEEKAMEEKAVQNVMSLGADKKTALRWLDQADAYFMYGGDDFYEDSIEKYGWVAKHFDNVAA
tara:strand:+ start:693 stop:1058 length:366 start_codon:yes stop_codon:yes gene_type:complete